MKTGTLALGFVLATAIGASSSGAWARTELAPDSVEFTAPTNLRAITVHGKGTALSGSVLLEGHAWTAGTISLSVESLDTGMSFRDRHMREKVFRTSDGKYPPIQFSWEKGEKASCSEASPCSIHGALSIRAVTRPAIFDCFERDSTAECSTTVKLSNFAIDRPSQLGIQVLDEIPVRVLLRRK
jgi:polyisoprenoid-binding protein YceI